MDPAKEIPFCNNIAIEAILFPMCEASLKALLEIEFAMSFSVQAQHATYNHVVVIWRKMVIDYESKYIYPLTEDSLRQVCGFTTTFQRITCGNFPSRQIRQSPENVHIKDWGTSEYYEPGGSISKYFKKNK